MEENRMFRAALMAALCALVLAANPAAAQDLMAEGTVGSEGAQPAPSPGTRDRMVEGTIGCTTGKAINRLGFWSRSIMRMAFSDYFKAQQEGYRDRCFPIGGLEYEYVDTVLGGAIDEIRVWFPDGEIRVLFTDNYVY